MRWLAFMEAVGWLYPSGPKAGLQSPLRALPPANGLPSFGLLRHGLDRQRADAAHHNARRWAAVPCAWVATAWAVAARAKRPPAAPLPRCSAAVAAPVPAETRWTRRIRHPPGPRDPSGPSRGSGR